MYIKVDEGDRRPIYQQVADEIRGLIARGELAQGMQLPPVRQLAADLGANLNTIATAYRELQDDGLITIKHGSGAVVASQTASDKDEDRLRNGLRNALTQLILAGLSRRKILDIVVHELGSLTKGSR